MKKYKTYYKRNLPHYQPIGYTFFVTYRLNGSLPVEVILKLQAERERALKKIAGYDNISVRKEKYRAYQSLYFGKFDKLLDGAGYGPTWLKNDDSAQIVKDAMHYYDKNIYNLICYTIMSNHVHQVFTPIIENVTRSEASSTKAAKAYGNEANASFYIVTKILQDLKSKTALKCNKILGRSGAFWQHESYDHVVRNHEELMRIVQYVLNNPVKAGLSEKWEDWKWSYCNFELL